MGRAEGSEQLSRERRESRKSRESRGEETRRHCVYVRVCV